MLTAHKMEAAYRSTMNDTTLFGENGGIKISSFGSPPPGCIGMSGGNRRRKKRPSYGVRTVEITKGVNGFGFTISGQAPCMLSFIVLGSSADKSGLRVGDYLIAVNGQNVSRAPHDEVVQTIGNSNVLKLQIAENYYSDSSDDEFISTNRPKPKFPNRLRHKQQQTRAERVVRDFQSGAIFSERAAMQLEEAALLSDRDWPDTLPGNFQKTVYQHKPVSQKTAEINECPASPTRRRLLPVHYTEPRLQATTSPHHFDEQVARARLSPVKNEKVSKGKIHPLTFPHQYHQDLQKPSLPQRIPSHHMLQHQYHQHPVSHNSNPVDASNLNPPVPSTNGHPPSSSNHHPHIHRHMDTEMQYQQQNKVKQKPHHQHILYRHHHLEQPTTSTHLKQNYSNNNSNNPSANNTLQMPNGASGETNKRMISEQEINKILYPTLAELQLHGPPPDITESLYRAVVGYLGTIEVPKDSQGGSRLTAIKNCIRRLRIEKKVHTLVLMSVFTERVVLTNPHGVTLAQYPAERITFCGAYADDKKFFGLVTVHGCTSDEFSDTTSQDGEKAEQGISSSCHVFMVDPKIVSHSDHARRAKNFRLDCTPAREESALIQCREFPESADPILQTIMSLYRSQPGFNFDNGGQGDEAQMSPHHSNTSSNSSNSDSGIGFRDDGASHMYSRHERVFVVEVDDNKRMRIQNYHLVGNSSRNNNNPVANNATANSSNSGTYRISSDSAMASLNGGPNSCNLRTKDSEFSGPSYSNNSENGLVKSSVKTSEAMVHRTVNSNTNPRTSSSERNKNNYRAVSTAERLRPSKCEAKTVKASMSCNFTPNIENFAPMEGEDSSDFVTKNMTDFLKAGLSDSNRRRRSESRTGAETSAGGDESITDELRASLLITGRGESRSSLAGAVDCRPNVTERRTPSVECSSPSDVNRLTVRAMPDPLTLERSPLVEITSPPHVNAMRYSMHKYLQSKQQQLVKVSQKINRRDSDTDGIHPLSVRAFSPANAKKKASTPTPSTATTTTTATSSTQNSLDLELSLKLSPKVYGLPMACLPSKNNSDPSEKSFSRSLEDLRDSSDGVNSSMVAEARGSFRDGSESDQCLERFKQCPLPSRFPMARFLRASETNLSSYNSSNHSRAVAPSTEYPPEVPFRGAFTAVAPRSLTRSETENFHPDEEFPLDALIPVSSYSNGSPPVRDTDGGEAMDSTLMGPPLSTTVLRSYNSDTVIKRTSKSDNLSKNSYVNVVERRSVTSESTEDEYLASRKAAEDILLPHEEYTLASDFDNENDGSEKKWSNKHSRNINRNNNDIHSDNEASDSVGGHSESSPAGDLRVANWSSSFEKLLEDSAALHTFAEFLKKEYSHENIYFWTACERYRLALSGGATQANKVWSEWSDRHSAASAIYNTHLGPNAPEPVNVDSGARSAAKEGLNSPTQDLFAPAQKQIFNLMKFDSYSRFLKSSMYQECLERENRGEPLQFSESKDLDPNLRIGPLSNDLVKAKSDIEERRRRSLLPWHRSKDRSKSRDRLGGERNKRTNSVHKNKGKSKLSDTQSGGRGSISLKRLPSDSSSGADVMAVPGGSTSSLNHLEGAVRRVPSKESVTSSECLSLSGGEGSGGTSGRCRVVLPDKSESVVAVRHGISVERVMRRLLDRRGLKFLAFNITHSKTDKLIGSSEDSSVLNGSEVRLQQLVLFRLDLPNQKTVCVKAKPHKQATDVLRPILAKYGFKLDLMHIHTLEDPKPINVKGPITELDGQKYIVQTKEDVKEWGVTALNQQSTNSSLDVITNRVFEDLLHSKADHQLINDYDARSTKTDQDSDNCVPQRLAPVTKPKTVETRLGNLTPGKDSDELYEGLKRAQMSRIEDQRGTEINSELPDFLKSDAENKRPLAVMDDNARLMNFFSQSNTYLHPNQQVETHHHTNHNHTIDYGDNQVSHNPSSLTQHQSHHNFWSDISAGGSSIPSSLLATSSSSLSSTSLHNFKDKSTLQNFHAKTSDGSLHTLDIDAVTFMATPHAGVSSHLDMQYRGHSFVDSHNTIVNNSRRDKQLRPRPESCVNILPSSRRSGLPIESIVNSVINSSRPKSSCGSLLNSINTNKYQGGENDLDETITPENVNRRMQRPINRILDGVIKPPSLTKSSPHVPPSAIFSSPPPPLPPKPKLGIPPRGPPPRPPSRQLPMSHGIDMQNSVADPISFV